jgi:hypothetical protein
VGEIDELNQISFRREYSCRLHNSKILLNSFFVPFLTIFDHFYSFESIHEKRILKIQLFLHSYAAVQLQGRGGGERGRDEGKEEGRGREFAVYE